METMLMFTAIYLFHITIVETKENTTFCPQPFGKFPDPHPAACDTYYNCFNSIPERLVCSHGLHFNLTSKSCTYPEEAKRQNCEENPVCLQLHGTFADPDPAVCDTYYDCIHGVPNKVVCSCGLHFDKNKKACTYSKDAGRQNCEKKNPVDCNPTCQRGTCNCPNKCSCTTSWSTERCNKEFYGAANAGEVSFIQGELSTRSSSDLRLNWRNKDEFNYTALHIATFRDKLSVVHALLDAEASTDMQSEVGQTPVYIAAQYGHIAVLRVLLEPTYGANVNLPTNNGQTPIYAAAILGQTAALELLIAHGGAVNLPENDGETPVYAAAGEGQTAALKVLIAHGGDVNKLRINGTSPLAIASQYGHVEAVRALLNASAINIDYVRPIDGYTALHYAAYYNQSDVATLLLQNNVDKRIENKYGETPADLATRFGHDAVAEIITNYNNS